MRRATLTSPITAFDTKGNELSARRSASVRFGRGLVMHGWTAHQQGGVWWISALGRPLFDRDGSVLRESDGKVRYQAVVEWTDRRLAERFRQAALDALLAQFPNAFDEEDAA